MLRVVTLTTLLAVSPALALAQTTPKPVQKTHT